ncbi:MAG: ATP-binding protein [Paracoccaceae bacterium]
MISKALKKYMPKRLFARALLIMVVPIVALQFVVATVFIQRHFARVTEQMTRSVAIELNMVIAEVKAARNEQEIRAYLSKVARPLQLSLDFTPGGRLSEESRRNFYDVSGGSIIATLRGSIAHPLAIDLVRDFRRLYLDVDVGSGVLHAVVSRSRMNASNPHQLLVLMVFTSVLLIIIAVVFLRNQVRPIRRLAMAAEAFGKGRSLPFRSEGAEEVRRAGTAFLAMRARLERQMEQRTQMLSGVSHDLRTPLTRMKLSLGMAAQTPEIREIIRDVDEMERLLDEFLAFARGDSLEEISMTDPMAIARRIVRGTQRSGASIRFSEKIGTPGNCEVPLRPGAVERAVQNLVNNAVRHGRTVAMTVRLLPKMLEFVVEDDGPGIPAGDRDRAIRPFTRLDESRNQNLGSRSGLGLSIALDVARSHGGRLVLGNSPELGGLKATLTIPR